MANSVLIAKGAAIVLTDEKLRKAAGWVLVAVLSPLILLIAFLCSLGSGASGHNASAVEVCFNGAAIPASAPTEYRACLENMRSSLALVDTAVSTINAQAEEGTSLDAVRVKAIFYALYFGAESHGDARALADCFVTYEERTRMVPVEGSDPPEQAEEKYTVAVPITDMGTVWQNIASAMDVMPTAEQRANADSVYSLVKYGWAGSGTGGIWSGDIGEPVLSVDGFCSPLGSGWQSRVTSEFGWRNCPYAYGRELRQLGELRSGDELVENLRGRILPHQNRGSLKSRTAELVEQTRRVCEKASAPGLRSEVEKRELAESWLELAVSCAKVSVKYVADNLKQQQQQEQVAAMNMEVM